MLQLALAIESYAPARRGSVDIRVLKKHVLKVFDGMADKLASSPLVSKQQDENLDADFLFGGYSWIKKQFELWSISFCPRDRKFIAQPAQWLSYIEHSDRMALRRKQNAPGSHAVGKIAFAGDRAPEALELLSRKLANDAKRDRLDMEPFEVVRDMLRDPNHSETIGGAPQIVKVYQYMRTAVLGVYWPTKTNGAIFIQGRERIGYERLDQWILDPDTLVSDNEAHTDPSGKASESA